MKRIIGILLILLNIVIGLGCFFNSESSFMKVFFNEFDTTINIVTKSENIKTNIYEIQKLAKNNNINFIKDVYEPRNRLSDKQKVKIYMFLSEKKWFIKSFRNIKINTDKDKLNKFKNATDISLLTTKDLELIPFEEIDECSFNGDYHIKGNTEDIRNFLEELNGSNSLNINATIDENFSVASDFTQRQAFLYLLFILILIIALIFSLIIYNGSMSKEIAIVKLLGYKNINYCLEKVFRLLVLPLFISIIIITMSLYHVVKPDSFNAYIHSMNKIYLILLFVTVVFFINEFIMLYLKMKNISIISWLKGYKKSYAKSSVFVKMISVTSVLYLMIASILGFYDYMTLKPHIETWERAKNYSNIACSWPWSYVEDDDKFKEAVVPKLNNLWDELEKEGAILFDAPNAWQEGMAFNEDYSNSEAFNGRFAYINNNYLRINKIFDKENKLLSHYKINNGEWIIFVPENIKIDSKDKEIIKEEHKSEIIFPDNKTSEIYVPIKAGQTFFSFDSQKKLDEPDIRDYILIMVNGKELNSTSNIKLPSLINGKYHPYIKDQAKGYESLKPIIEKTNSKPYILYISSIYNEASARIDLFKLEAMIYSVGFLLSLLILGALLEIDKESYFYNDGKRIDVSRLLGYDFVSIHKKKITKSTTNYIISMILLLFVIIFTSRFNHFGFFTPRGGWTINKILIVIFVSMTLISTSLSIEIKKIKRKERNIVGRLKEGY